MVSSTQADFGIDESQPRKRNIYAKTFDALFNLWSGVGMAAAQILGSANEKAVSQPRRCTEPGCRGCAILEFHHVDALSLEDIGKPLLQHLSICHPALYSFHLLNQIAW
jgi:hypothetical protein